MQLRMNINAIAAAVFLPVLYWTGAVVAVTLFGYPGVVCTTPLAWLLALPAGFRLARQSTSPMPNLAFEGAVAGGLLGVWQGLLMLVAALLDARLRGEGIPLADAWQMALLAMVIGAPVCAGLAALAAWWSRRTHG